MATPWKTDQWFSSPWNYLPEVTEGFQIPQDIQVHDVTLRDGEQQAGVEFTADCPAGTKAKVTAASHQEGMVMLGTSTFETVRFIPPLVISADEVDVAVSKFDRACAAAFS